MCSSNAHLSLYSEPNLFIFCFSLFPQSPGISFGQWFAFATPTMVVSLLTALAFLSSIFCDDWYGLHAYISIASQYKFICSFGCCKLKLLKTSENLVSRSTARNVIKRQYRALGSWRYQQRTHHLRTVPFVYIVLQK